MTNENFCNFLCKRENAENRLFCSGYDPTHNQGSPFEHRKDYKLTCHLPQSTHKTKGTIRFFIFFLKELD